MRERELVDILVNGRAIQLPRGAMVSSALLMAGIPSRISVNGQPRAALCGMGICFECRAVVNGIAHVRTCQMPCLPGMKVETLK
jgi:D-hydroxyproline dehydrogenase subunit gamma